MSIVGYFGAQGSGKTLSMIRDMYELHTKGFSTMTNIKLNFEHDLITSKDLQEYTKKKEQLKNYNIAIDEVHLWFNSRRSMSKKSVIMTYMVAQMRKKGNHLFYTTQTIRKPDVILREETDVFHFPQIMYLYDGEFYKLNSTAFDKIPDDILPDCWVKDKIWVKRVENGLEDFEEYTRWFRVIDFIGLYDTTFIVGFDE